MTLKDIVFKITIAMVLGGSLNLFASTGEKVGEIKPKETLEELIGLGFQRIAIPQKGFADLPISDSIANPIFAPLGNFEIDGKKMYLQNVSGMGNRCFFNAMGLKREHAISLLFANKEENRFVRLAFVNEIVSSLENPDQLPYSVLKLIGYEGFVQSKKTIFALEEEKNVLNKELEELAKKIKQQVELNGGKEGSADEALYVRQKELTLILAQDIFQNLTEKHELLLQQVRLKAASLDTFMAYLKEYIAGGQMMVCLPQVQGDDIGLLTVIDAISYLYDTGIRVFTFEPLKKGQLEKDVPYSERKLRLTHSFVHKDSTKVKYILHHGIHFMSFMPVTE
jgi:hypothetical protein